MKRISTIIFLLLIPLISFAAEDFYSLGAKKINGDSLSFSELEGKKLLIVNTASYCGYTSQYAQLQQLYEEYGGDNFEIIGFPANNFMNQEPGSDEDIEDFCKSTYGVTFTMMSKISVKGADIHPVYQWLTQKDKNGVMDSEVQWNFQKYLINEDGTLYRWVATQVSPMNSVITEWLTPNSVEELNNTQVAVYPNPASDYIIIPDIEFKEIRIVSSIGTEVIQPVASNNSGKIDISTLIPGLYFVIIDGKTTPFIKN